MPKFKVGDLVAVSKKMTWALPMPGNDKFRKDINIGHEGKITVLDKDGQVFLDVTISTGVPQPLGITRKVVARNLKLTKDFNREMAEQEAEDLKNTKTEDAPGPSKSLKWLQQKTDSKDLIVEASFKNLLNDHDKVLRLNYLRSHILVGLEAIFEILPTMITQIC